MERQPGGGVRGLPPEPAGPQARSWSCRHRAATHLRACGACARRGRPTLMHNEPERMASGIVRSDRRVVITGIGVTAPGGIGSKAFWERLTAGRTATRSITLFDASGFRSRVAAECDFNPAAEGLSPQEIRRMDRAAQFGVVCAREALADSGLDVEGLTPERTAVTIGSAVGCTTGLEEEYVVLSNGGREWLVDHSYGVPHLYGYMVPSTLAAEVAWTVGAEGPVALISTG